MLVMGYESTSYEPHLTLLSVAEAHGREGGRGREAQLV
jgi:hypothetical protein